MVMQVSIYGNQLGLDHNGNLVSQPHSGLTGYTDEVSFESVGLTKTLVTSAELLALFATPKTLVAAPPSGFGTVFVRALIYKAAGTAYAGIAAGEDLVVKATDAAGAQVSGVIETTGFLDSALAQTRSVGAIGATGATAADVTPLAAALVLHLLIGEITTGTSPLIVHTYFRRVPLVLTL